MNNTCCVCLQEGPLFPLTDTDSDNNTTYSKLQSVVPEVQWNYTFLICSNCLKTLKVVLKFRNLCLKSSSYRIEQKEKKLSTVKIDGIKENNDGESSYDEEIGGTNDHVFPEEWENSEHTENLCKIKCKSDKDLYIHNKEIHKTSYTCSSCFQSFLKEIDFIDHKRTHKNRNYRLESNKHEVISMEVKENEVEKHQDTNISQYEKCDETFSTKTDIEKHKISQNVFICFHCNKSFKSKVMLSKHIKVLHENGKMKCSLCRVICTNEALLKEHYKKIHDISDNNRNKKNKLYKCNKCEKSYKIEKVMKNHFQSCDGIKRHSKLNFKRNFIKNRCEICGKFYTTEKILKAHMKTCNGPKVKMGEEEIKCYLCNTLLVNDKEKLDHVLKEHNVNLNIENICQYCYKQFLNPEECKNHLVEIHSEDIFKREKRSYSCEVCSKVFRYVKDLIEHCVMLHEMHPKLVKPFLCDKCDTRFTSSANMIQHKQYHEGTRRHICSFCGKSYITKSDLTVHEYTHLNKRNYKCEFCDKAFNTNKNLRSHKLVVHTDSSLWKYQCDMCDKRFPLKSGYDQHIRRHAGDKRFPCLICSKCFISSSELRKHMTFHSNVKAFKCCHCDKEYKDRRVYEIHLTKIHGIGNAKIPIRIKKFACHVCPSTFFDKQKLSRHLCTHTGIKPYACTMCEKRFTDKSYLKHHLKVAHNVVELQLDDMRDVKIMQVM